MRLAYLDSSFEEPLPSLINPEVLRVLPNILNLPHIHVDPVMVLIYYCVLYKGLAMNREKSISEKDLLHKIYICSIRSIPAWQRQANGSVADFCAASFMVKLFTILMQFSTWKSALLTENFLS